MPIGHRSSVLGTIIAIVGAVVVAGCGASAGGGPGVTPKPRAKAAASPALPPGWGRLRLPSGAVLPYPASWRKVGGDPGSASAALFGGDGTIRAYLNATPADPNETVSDWARFRVRHNAAEGDRHVRLISAQTGVVLGGQRGSCVIDDYATSRSEYRELACIVAPAKEHATVLVAAAQPRAWAREQPVLRFALSHFVS